METVKEIADFPRGVSDLSVLPGGDNVVARGPDRLDGTGWTIRAVDGRSGEGLWAIPTGRESRILPYPSGKALAVLDALHADSFTLFEMPSRAVLAQVGRVGHQLAALGPEARQLVATDAATLDHPARIVLLEQGRKVHLFQMDAEIPGTSYRFSPDGRNIAWGHSDGTVAVLDLREIQRRLSGVGMGW
jgi:hypothetical protein